MFSENKVLNVICKLSFCYNKDKLYKIIEFAKEHKKKKIKKGINILIACFPKSGSTFLSSLLLELTKFQTGNYVYKYSQREQELDVTKLIDLYEKNIVVQQHVKGTDINIKLLKEFGITPVILVRNIFDIVISLRDHIHNESYMTPLGYINSGFFNLNEELQYDFIIEMIVPWYINFYASWYDVIFRDELKTMLIAFEEFIPKKEYYIKKVLEFYNIRIDKAKVSMVLNNKKKIRSRFNKGVIGRGEKLLTPNQKDKIRSFSRFYPDTDFSIIGIF